MTKEQIQALRDLEQQATRGLPWAVSLGQHGRARRYIDVVATQSIANGEDVIVELPDNSPQSAADAELIAAMRNAFAELLDIAESVCAPRRTEDA